MKKLLDTKTKKFTLFLATVSLLGALLSTFYIGKFIMDNETKEIELKVNLNQTKKEVTELLEWNYKDVNSVTFEYVPPKNDSGIIRIDFDKSLTTTPAGGVSMNGYINNDGEEIFGIGLNDDLKLDKDSLPTIGSWVGGSDTSGVGSTEVMQKASSKNPHILDAVPDKPGYYYSLTGPENYYLDLSDIQKLKEKGYTKDITFEQIKAYFDGGRK